MGQDKALLTLEPGGPPLVEIVAGHLRQVVDDVLLVGDAPSGILPDLRRIPDSFPGSGPLGGIHAALTAASGGRVLVVACDMPFLSVELMRYMASLPDDADAIVPVQDELQPLHAIYGPSCLPHIERNLRDGGYKVTAWFDRVQVQEIDRDTMARFDPELLSCFNMNTPDDLAYVLGVAAGHREAAHTDRRM
jgi:molybdopterin-guanine dinucleotide biosynthesis protein A